MTEGGWRLKPNKTTTNKQRNQNNWREVSITTLCQINAFFSLAQIFLFQSAWGLQFIWKALPSIVPGWAFILEKIKQNLQVNMLNMVNASSPLSNNNIPGLKNTIALRQACSVSSTFHSFMGSTSSSRTRIAILRTSVSAAVLGITRSFPSNKTSFTFIERRAQPSIKCSEACARSKATWSSSNSSQKAGMCFAHSTNTRSCWRIDSQISP